MKHLIFLLVFGVFATTTRAQNAGETGDLPSPPIPYNQPVKFENLTLEDGLSQGSIYAIHQDRKGFMWFGTQEGISRYDGYTFKNFKHVPFDSTSAQTSWVLDVAEDSTGALWLAAAYGGVSRLDPATETFTHFTHDPKDSTSLGEGWAWGTLVDRDGILWIGMDSGGLSRMDPERPGTFEHFRHDPDDSLSLSSDHVRALFQDAAGSIWVSTFDGLNRMNPQEPGRFDRFLVDPRGPESEVHRDYVMNRLYEGPEKVIWAATADGLVRLDTETGDTRRFIPPPGTERESVAVFSVVRDPQDVDVLWLAMPGGGGIVRFDTSTETYLPFRHDPGDPSSPAGNFATSAHTDRSGTVWVGMEGDGIIKFNPAAVSFSDVTGAFVAGGLANTTMWDLHVDSRGNLWAAADGGTLQVLDRNTGSVRTWTADAPNPEHPNKPAGIVRQIAEDAEGKLWLATTRGLDLFDPLSGRFTHFRHDPDDSTSVPSNSMHAVHVDRGGTIWVGFSGPSGKVGLTRYDPTAGKFSTYRNDSQRASSIRSNVVWSIAEDHAGRLWFGREGGVSSMKPDELDKFRHYDHDPGDPETLTNGNVTYIHERSREPGVLWVATGGGGLDRLDVESGSVKHYTELTSDLPNNFIYTILEDEDGRLWMSTNRGVSRLDPDSETFTNYGIEHGLQSLEFNQYSAAQSPDGEMFFGGVNGVNSFYPDEVRLNTVPPPVALADLRLFNERVVVGPDSPLKQSLDLTREIELTHDQARNVGFDFVALHYKNSQLNRYAYRLEGFDSNWIDAGTQRSATYTNLPPGHYTFRVRAANSDGVWNEQGASVALIVRPPWWRTTWAYILYVLLFIGVLAALGVLQRRRLKRKAEFEQAELRARAAESHTEAAEARARALQADNERKKNAELLSEIGKELTSSLDLETIFDRVYEHVNHLVDANVFGIGLYNHEKQQLEYRLAIENGKRYAPYTRDTNDKNQFPVWCIENRKPVFVNDVDNEYTNYIESYEHIGGQLVDGALSGDPQSLIYLPLLAKDRVLGVISIQSFEKNAYSDHDLNILRALATYTAIAVDNADAYRRLNGTLDHLKNAQQQLVQQEKLASLGQLTAGIAHEIKNPLNFVTNFSVLNEELAAELDDLVSSHRDEIPTGLISEIEDLVTSLRVNAGHVAKHGRRADSIVKSMMEHASGGQGERFPVDVNAFIDEYVTLAYHGRRAQSPGIELYVERDFEPGLGSAEMAPQELGRVIVNLLNNAFDAVAEKGGRLNGEFHPTVTVRTRLHGEHVRITVEDNGPGIPDIVRAHIFEPFFTTKPTGSGTGLGLSLSYDIVTQGHGGHLDVDSTDGRGAAFTITLPINGKAAIEIDAAAVG